MVIIIVSVIPVVLRVFGKNVTPVDDVKEKSGEESDDIQKKMKRTMV